MALMMVAKSMTSKAAKKMRTLFVDGGSVWEARQLIFYKDSTGYSFMREFGGLFGSMTSASKTGNGLGIKTKTMTNNDARCCPTGETAWRL